VIHRDIKPENILLHDGQALVADFGIALAVRAAGGERLTETGLSLGTPQYMSPEQATADRELDARSDVYSLGCVVYEMLVGDPPHTGSTAQVVISKVITQEPQRITAVRKAVPPHVEAAVHTALAKLPADRFAGASQFAEALTNPSAVVASAVAAAAPLGATAVVGLAVRHRWLRWGIPLSLALLAATSLWGWLRPRPSTDGSPVRFEVVFPASGRIASWPGNRITLSPDGAHLVYLGEGDRGQQLYVRPMDQLEARPLFGTEEAGGAFFSPDGRWIGFSDGMRGGRLRKVPLEGGPPTTIVEHDLGSGMRGASWGEDGTIVLGSTTGLWLVRADGGSIEQLTEVDTDRGELQYSSPELLPGGSGVLFHIWNGTLEENQVAVLSFATGEVKPLFGGSSPRYSETGHLVYGRTDGVLMAVPFDPVRLEVTGPAMTLLEGVMVKPSGGMEFDIARNGSLVYLTGAAGRGEVVIVDRHGGERSLRERPDVFFSPRFSPDGMRLALGIGQPPRGQQWILEIEQEILMPLTFEGNNVYPVWSWDGERVVFASDRDGVLNLFWKPANGSGVAEPLLRSDHWQLPASLSRDGRYLIYRENHPDTGRDIWFLPLAGDGSPRAYLTTPHDEYTPQLSPDGRWLAYTSNVSGQDEVYVGAFPDAGAPRRVSADGGTEPQWGPAGRELFYRNGRALMAAAVETTPDFRVRSRAVLFEGPYTHWVYHSNYDVHPDGDRFVMIKPVEAVSTRLVVVLNWFEELKARVGN
jgi:serine/threonine-protein kinase